MLHMIRFHRDGRPTPSLSIPFRRPNNGPNDYTNQQHKHAQCPRTPLRPLHFRGSHQGYQFLALVFGLVRIEIGRHGKRREEDDYAQDPEGGEYYARKEDQLWVDGGRGWDIPKPSLKTY